MLGSTLGVHQYSHCLFRVSTSGAEELEAQTDELESALNGLEFQSASHTHLVAESFVHSQGMVVMLVNASRRSKHI